MLCNHCGFNNREGASFCSQCGTPLEKEIIEVENVETVIDAEIVEEPVVETEVTEEPVVEEVFVEEVVEEPVVEEIFEEEVVEEAVEEKPVCPTCHNEIYDTTVLCPHCGSLTQNSMPVYISVEDKSNPGLNLIALLSPIIGFIAYLTFKKALPSLSKAMRNFACIGLVAYILFILVFGLGTLLHKETCSYTNMNGQKCSEEVYSDGYCEYHYQLQQQQNSFFDFF